jgi:hypothetical protein
MPPRTRAEASRRWKVWAGDEQRLRRLIDRAEAVAKPIVDAETRELEAIFSPPSEDISSEVRAMFDEQREEELDKARDRLRPYVRITERDLSLTYEGSPDEVFPRIDPSALTSLTISVPGTPSLAGMTRIRFSDLGCSCSVEGENPEWVRSADASLAAEIAKGVPWWTWMRDGRGKALYFLTGALIAMSWILEVAAPELRRDMTRMVLISLQGAILGGVAAAAAAAAIVARLLPSFELTPPGMPGRGSRAVGALATLLASFVLGLLTNALTR